MTCHVWLPTTKAVRGHHASDRNSFLVNLSHNLPFQSALQQHTHLRGIINNNKIFTVGSKADTSQPTLLHWAINKKSTIEKNLKKNIAETGFPLYLIDKIPWFYYFCSFWSFAVYTVAKLLFLYFSKTGIRAVDYTGYLSTLRFTCITQTK